MAFTTGTATDFHDLLDKLRLYAVAQGWTELAWTAPAVITDTAVLHLRGPGAGAGKQVFISIQTHTDVSQSIYSWELRGATDYDSGLGWGLQAGQSPTNCYLNLWENSIDYWFFVNDRRIIVIAKCSTNYMSAYLGFYLPWGTPAQFPFPLYIAGDFYQKQPHSYNYAARRMMVDPGNSTSSAVGSSNAGGYARTATGVWYPTANHTASANNNNPKGWQKGQRCHMWPYHSGHGGGANYNQTYGYLWGGGTGAGDAASYGLESMVPTQQNERWIMPVMLLPGDQSPLGVLDAAYCVGGSGLAAEQQLTLGARTFRVFQNIARNSPDDFFCVEEV